MSTDVMKGLEARAKADPQRVVLPEANEEKIVRAAREVRDRGLAIPVLVGEPGAVTTIAEAIGVSIEGIAIVDAADQTRIEYLAGRFSSVTLDYPARAVKRLFYVEKDSWGVKQDSGTLSGLVPPGIAHSRPVNRTLFDSQLLRFDFD